MTTREQKGLQIAATTKLKKRGQKWLVPSQSGAGTYEVVLDKQCPTCTCPDHEQRGVKCKHILAVEYTFSREQHKDGTTTVTEKIRVTYSQDWPAYNMAQKTEKEHFQVLLSDLCKTIAEPEQPMGRKRLPLSDMTFACAFKVYSCFSGRRFTTDMKTAHQLGHVSKLPSYNSMFRYFEKPELTPIIHSLIVQSSLPLKA